MDIIAELTKELGIERWQTQAAVDLIDADNTIPFISRYRKEATGALNDEVLRQLNERLTYFIRRKIGRVRGFRNVGGFGSFKYRHG